MRVSIGDIADLLELSPREIEELRKLHNDPKPKEVNGLEFLEWSCCEKKGSVREDRKGVCAFVYVGRGCSFAVFRFCPLSDFRKWRSQLWIENEWKKPK